MPTLTCLLLLLGALLLPAHASAAVPPSLSGLLTTVVERNALAHEVAASKYARGRPVEDRVREQEVLAAKREQAGQLGLDADAVVAFYQQLIEANKLVQHMDYQAYRTGRPVPVAPPLDDLRRRINQTDQRMLAWWAQASALRGTPLCVATLAAAIQDQQHAGALPTAVAATALVRGLVGFCQPDGAVNVPPGAARA